MEDLELECCGDHQAGKILSRDHDELQQLLRGADWQFNRGRVHIRRSCTGKRNCRRNSAEFGHDTGRFVHDNYDSNLVNSVEKFPLVSYYFSVIMTNNL